MHSGRTLFQNTRGSTSSLLGKGRSSSSSNNNDSSRSYRIAYFPRQLLNMFPSFATRTWAVCAALLLTVLALSSPSATEAGGRFSFVNYPLHASCKITWSTKEDCKAARNALLTAAQSMGMDAPCGSGEKCNYSVVQDEDNFLKTTHVTPTTPHYTDTQTFDFTDASGRGGCTIEAKSSSNVFYAYLDNGTNYCNLHNLIDATALTYTEETDISQCTQFDLPPDCEVN